MAKLVTVGAFTSPWEAHLAKGRLEAEGIPAFVAHEHHIGANWVISHALGGVKVQVASENAEQAAAILKAHANGEYEAALKDEFPDIERNVCPKCGSAGFKSTVPIRTMFLLLATLGLVGVIFPVRKERHVCLQCGNIWKS